MAFRPFGSIVGTLGTTFFLIPSIGTRAITLTLGVAGIVVRPVADRAAELARRDAALALALALLALPALPARANDLIDDEHPRRHAQARRTGRIAHIETEYNDIFITKRRDRADHVVPAQGLRLHRIRSPT